MTVRRMACVRHFRSIAAVTLPLVVIAGCGSEGKPGGDASSVGHSIISNDNRENVQQWTLSPTPMLDIGAGEGQALVMVTAGLMHGGQIIVADVGAGTLRYFDRAGRVVRSVGSPGSGPGEFQFMGWLGLLPGDSVAVWDPSLRRLSVFNADGRLARMATLRFTQGPLPRVLGTFDDGALLIADPAASTQTAPPGTAWRDTLVYLRVAPDGTIADTLGRFPGAEWYAAGATGRVHSLPFGRQAAAAVQGNRFYVGTGDGYEVAAFAADGTERVRFRRPYRPVSLAPKDVDDYQAASIQVGGTPEERRERARELREAPYPRTLPPYTSLAVDTRGNVWVREPYPPGKLYQSSHWSVFDTTGRWIATAQGPGRFKALQIGPDWVLGTETDGDDVEHVRLYALSRSD
ncbi:MAG TPA: hypothetical protein VGC13_27230 [Longimicrobium sp.]|uniref:hypothetical protein n=1 Tax=Longimicrobium sp. TaxID=2029185 RepID=UPI002ED7A844